jgi:hypothetical protein
LVVRFLRKAAGPLLLLLGLVFLVLRNGPHVPVRASSIPALAGRVIDSQAQPVRRAKAALYLDSVAIGRYLLKKLEQQEPIEEHVVEAERGTAHSVSTRCRYNHVSVHFPKVRNRTRT